MQQCAPEVFVPARSTRTVETGQTEPRHARLFELIRQEYLSDVLSEYIDKQRKAVEAQKDTDTFLADAEKSLGSPSQAA